MITDWSTANNLRLNIDKTNNSKFSYNTTAVKKYSIKFLGVWLDKTCIGNANY